MPNKCEGCIFSAWDKPLTQCLTCHAGSNKEVERMKPFFVDPSKLSDAINVTKARAGEFVPVSTPHDPVNHPSHYCAGGIEPLDFIEANPHLGPHEANIIKYVCRHKFKNGVEDLKKARFYLKRLINLREREGYVG